MSEERRAFGIDLGTTHTALARWVEGERGGKSELAEIQQLVEKDRLAPRTLVPSFLYFAHASEGALGLPWDAERTAAVGEYARLRGAEAAERVIGSAKSWLSYAAIDRRKGALPLHAPDDIEKISPVEASFRILEHLVDAARHQDGVDLTEADVVLTVPASFDASARDLTVEAAMAAGIEHLTLLEEPQAALYAWLEAHAKEIHKVLVAGDVILVVDVGGGTTDLSAIEVLDEDGTLGLSRVAVGDHILLGGDNMDLALAYTLQKKLEADGKAVDKSRFAALTFAARAAKERLLGDEAKEAVPVAIQTGSGAKLLGNTARTELTRSEVEALVLDGFFPVVAATDKPTSRLRAGLREVGLPYAQDAGITRHLAAFLSKHAGLREGRGVLPTKVLFNGGVMKSALLRRRVMEVLAGFATSAGAPPPVELASADLDHAVARGAAYYAGVRRGKGIRIRGGTARAYYVGIEGAVPAVPGLDPPVTALCVAPIGMDEGTKASLPRNAFAVVVGEPVILRFFGSTSRADDAAGAELERWSPDELTELPPIEITLPAEGRAEGDVVPVFLEASITEVGTLLLEAVPAEPSAPDERWKVELNVREG